MDDLLTITALARKTGVSSKALRYWEKLGLLPKATRSHSGYRQFPAEAAAYVGFVKRSKQMGLTLHQMKTVLKLARKGCSPCAEVETFIDHRIVDLEEKIKSLSTLLRSLRVLKQCCDDIAHDGDRSKECCSLLTGLPEAKNFAAAVEGENPRSTN